MYAIRSYYEELEGAGPKLAEKLVREGIETDAGLGVGSATAMVSSMSGGGFDGIRSVGRKAVRTA